MTTADAVAAYLIQLGHERGTPINNRQLQRLLYYAQAWHLGERGFPLFTDKFQAWIYGPVIPRLYWIFDVYGWQPIPRPDAPTVLWECDAAFVREIADEYLELDEWQLDEMTRRETPWLKARGATPRIDPSTAEISEDDMRAFFRHMVAA